MGSDETSEASWPLDATDSPHPHGRPRQPVPWFLWFLALAAAGALAWATFSPGGIGARLSGVSSSIRGTVADLTQNKALEGASKMFDGWYAQQGSYPQYSQSQLDDQPNASWGEGMDVAWCTPRDVVLTSLTASGTVSRLLLDGKIVGDVSGRIGCPVDLVNPAPWKV